MLTNYLGPLYLQVPCSHGISPSSCLKTPKLALLKCRVVILLGILFLPHEILNSDIYWSLQPSLPSTSTASTRTCLVSETKNQQHSPPTCLIHHLHQEVIISAPEELPGPRRAG